MDRSGRRWFFVKYWEYEGCENGRGRIGGRPGEFERKIVDRDVGRVPGSGFEV
jgi:hypothetical protein